jgi:hypothetical protein
MLWRKRSPGETLGEVTGVYLAVAFSAQVFTVAQPVVLRITVLVVTAVKPAFLWHTASLTEATCPITYGSSPSLEGKKLLILHDKHPICLGTS